MQKRFNLSYIWVTGIFIILLIILLLVVEYKVKYEDNVFYRYLYFYKCDSNFCTTDNINKISDHSTLLSVYKYDYHNSVPTYQYVIGNYIIINDNDDYLYYDYVKGEIINNYDNYKLIEDSYIIVNNDDKYGIIDIDNNIVLELVYSYIDYIDNYIITIEDNKLNVLDNNLTSLIASPIEIVYNSDISIIKENNNIVINIGKDKYLYDIEKKELIKG